MHTCNKTFTQNIWISLKNKNKKHHHLFLIRKLIYPVYSVLLVPAFKIREREEKKRKTDRDRYKLAFFCLQKKCTYIKIKNFQLSQVFYYFNSSQSIFKYFFKVFWYLYCFKMKNEFLSHLAICHSPASWQLAEFWQCKIQDTVGAAGNTEE